MEFEVTMTFRVEAKNAAAAEYIIREEVGSAWTDWEVDEVNEC